LLLCYLQRKYERINLSQELALLEEQLRAEGKAHVAKGKKLEVEVSQLKEKMSIESPVSGKVASIRLINITGDKSNIEILILTKNPFPNSSFPPLRGKPFLSDVEGVRMGGITNNVSEKCKVVSVSDGDTFSCRYGWTRTETIRLIGIDTPETKHPKKPVQFYGREASNFTKKMLLGKEVGLEYDVQQKDTYGRTLAYVYLEDGRMFNALLVQEGYAQASSYPPNVKYQMMLLGLQKEARANEKGLWSRQ